MESPNIFLFSYGTLQQPEVQLASFGRYLQGNPDSLPGYATTMLEISDPEVVRLSGLTHHPIVTVTGLDNDIVQGTVFAISADELAAADEYEVDDYRRELVTLASGTNAWVYLAASP